MPWPLPLGIGKKLTGVPLRPNCSIPVFDEPAQKMIPLHEKLDDITCGGTEVRVIAQGLVLEDGWAEAADERVALKQGEVTAIAFLADHVPWAADTQC